VLFEGMKAKPAGTASFVETGATWTFDGDATAIANAANQRLAMQWPIPQGLFFVYTKVTWIGESGVSVGAGPFTVAPTNQNDGWGCMMWNQGGSHVLALVDLPSTIGTGDSFSMSYENMGSYEIKAGFNPSTQIVSCSLQASGMSSPNNTTLPANAVAGITANGMSAKFSWVMIVK
jgi:hypothetical protein